MPGSERVIRQKHKDLLVAMERRSLFSPRRKLIVAVDGVDGVGKSTIAAFLSWQLSIPVANLDEFMTKGRPGELTYRTADLLALINSRLEDNRPVIVEGVFALEVLHQIGLLADYLIRVARIMEDGTLKTMSEAPGDVFQKKHKEYMQKFGHIQPDFVFENLHGELKDEAD